MASEALADLLGVSPDTSDPNAYQVLGLRTGESDPQRIADAVAAAVRRLKQRREEAPVEAWNEAAAAVKRARRILSDSTAKAAYDARLRKNAARQQPTALSTPSSTTPAAVVHDPLAGLLPTSDPFAPFDLQRAAADLAKPSTFQPTVVDPLAVSQPNAAVRAGEGRPMADPHRRRNSLPRVPILLSVLGFATLGGIAASVYVLTKPEPVAVGANAPPGPPPTQGTRSGGAAPEAEESAAPAAPGGPIVDGGPFAQGLGPALAADAANRADGFKDEGDGDDPSDPLVVNPGDDAAVTVREPPATQTTPAEPAPTASPANVPAAAMQPEQNGSLAEKRRTGELAYQQARQALMTQNWAQIKPLAEQAKEAAADAEQTQRAARLYQLAALADYYHGGIVQALEGLDAGATFELSDDPTVPLTVAVVEADASMLQIQFKGRNKSYAFDEIPFVLVHKIARFTMDLDSPTGMAAKAAFQAVCRLATPAHRQQAIEWLSQIDGEIRGANAEDLRAAIEQLDEA